jgi:hypothetical protein
MDGFDTEKGAGSGSSKAAVKVKAEIEDYLPRLLPVMWQSWLECSPGEVGECIAHASDMLLIVRTFLYLFKPTGRTGSTDDGGLGLVAPPNLAASVRRNLMAYFPLQLPEQELKLQNRSRVIAGGAQRQSVGATNATLATMLATDLAICQLILRLAAAECAGAMAGVRAGWTAPPTPGGSTPAGLGWCASSA